MHQQRGPTEETYPHGRGYGHDYMRGGEVLGGYGYSERDEYATPRGELHQRSTNHLGSEDDVSDESPSPSP